MLRNPAMPVLWGIPGMKDQLKLNTLGEMNLYLHARLQELEQRLLDYGDLTTVARMCEIEELIKMTNLENNT